VTGNPNAIDAVAMNHAPIRATGSLGRRKPMKRAMAKLIKARAV
jgi:hypothetical protein